MKSRSIILRLFIAATVCHTTAPALEVPHAEFQRARTRTRGNRPRFIRLSTEEMRARATQCAVPGFPNTQHIRAKGTVMVEIMVDTYGNVQSAKAVSGHPLLQASAVQAARKWKFKPVRIRRRAVKATGLLPLIFSNDKEEMEKQCEGLPRAP